MALTYSELEVALVEIAERNVQNKNKMIQAKSIIDTVVADLGNMLLKYAPVISAIDNGLQGNPDDSALKQLKSRADKFVSDFQTLTAQAEALQEAITEK